MCELKLHVVALVQVHDDQAVLVHVHGNQSDSVHPSLSALSLAVLSLAIIYYYNAVRTVLKIHCIYPEPGSTLWLQEFTSCCISWQSNINTNAVIYTTQRQSPVMLAMLAPPPQHCQVSTLRQMNCKSVWLVHCWQLKSCNRTNSV